MWLLVCWALTERRKESKEVDTGGNQCDAEKSVGKDWFHRGGSDTHELKTGSRQSRSHLCSGKHSSNSWVGGKRLWMSILVVENLHDTDQSKFPTKSRPKRNWSESLRFSTTVKLIQRLLPPTQQFMELSLPRRWLSGCQLPVLCSWVLTDPSPLIYWHQTDYLLCLVVLWVLPSSRLCAEDVQSLLLRIQCV